MQSNEHVLLLGPASTQLAELAERLWDLGHQTYHCDTPHEAASLLERDGVQLKMALIDASLADESHVDLVALSRYSQRDRLVSVGFGNPPAARTRQRLRSAGVELALWEPFGDHALRFQTNRALADPADLALAQARGDTRVPTDWQARVLGAGREKRVSVYSVSSGGAFLATNRPSPCGASLAIELPLQGGRTPVEAEVVYTNVPGNLRQTALPDGMAIRFKDGHANSKSRGSIRYSVAASASRLLV